MILILTDSEFPLPSDPNSNALYMGVCTHCGWPPEILNTLVGVSCNESVTNQGILGILLMNRCNPKYLFYPFELQINACVMDLFQNAYCTDVHVHSFHFISSFFSHRNVTVRKTTAQFLSLLSERMGPSRLMGGAKDVTERILPTAAQFVTDGGAETR